METEETVVRPGAPPCGSSSLSQSAVIPTESKVGSGGSAWHQCWILPHRGAGGGRAYPVPITGSFRWRTRSRGPEQGPPRRMI